MNKVILMGRLTRDPDVRWTNHGSNQEQMCIARLSLAVDRRGTDANGQRQADFIGCMAFGKTAEFIERYVSKGTKLLITGRIQTGSYVNSENRKVYTTDVVIEAAEFAESKKTAESEHKEPESTPSSVGEGFMNIPEGVEDEGLPFN